MKKWIILVILLLNFATSCKNPFTNPFDIFEDDDAGGGGRPNYTPTRVVEPRDKFFVAVGGVAGGHDELVIYDESNNVRNFQGQTLACAADDPIVILKTRPGFASLAEGSGVQIVAIEPGVTAIRCTVDGQDLGSVYEVTVPPQELIQILVAEAGSIIGDEATVAEVEGGSDVPQSSRSKTIEVLGMVIRNRIERINVADDPGMFSADVKDYDSDPPSSYYNAVINAPSQFAPTDRNDPTHEIFTLAQDRNFLEESWYVAYDQAVITASGIFNGDITDATALAFGFYSPTDDEWAVVGEALMWGREIPADAGMTDADFPSLAPIQLLIHPDVKTYEEGKKPSFIIVRSRQSTDAPITRVP